MRTLNTILRTSLSAGAALAALAAAAAVTVGAPAVAQAQNDVTPHLPNVLLLVDTSGSMEYLMNLSATGTPQLPGDIAGSTCATDGSTTVMNRWASLVSVLTGTYQLGAFGCQTVARNDPKFVTEFTLPGTPGPYDYDYYLPWNRIYTTNCTVGALEPTAPPQDWTAWGSNPYDYHTPQGSCHSPPAQNFCCDLKGQNQDGILDNFSGLVRFGLMTLDSFPDPSTGSSSFPATTTDYMGGYRGMWSYFHHWWANPTSPPTPGAMGDPTQPGAGEPYQCMTPQYLEVGARNVSAPPWEGPMVAFGDPASDYFLAQTNAKIQNELLSMRPYGASPIAGMLQDAEEFLFADDYPAPGVTPSYDFGPYNDVYWKNGCRKQYVILLTDGQPNLDLRGNPDGCDHNASATCPYRLPETILQDLYNGAATGNTPNQRVQTYVVGFAMANGGLPHGATSCSGLDPVADCVAPGPTYATCCYLNKLALAGSGNTQGAFFADDAVDLKTKLTTILSSIVGATTARTSPVYAPAGAADSQGGAFKTAPALTYHFTSSFNVAASASAGNIVQGGGSNGIWSGNLQRERYVCNTSAVPTPQLIDPNQGDDYAKNVTTPDSSHPRKFFTYVAPVDTVTSTVHSDWTIRPNIGSANDGFGAYGPGGTVIAPEPAASFIPQVAAHPLALGIAATGIDPNCVGAFALSNQPTQCVTALMNWEVGLANPAVTTAFGTPAPSRDPTSDYCLKLPNPNQCSLLGAIYHSTPAVVGPPREFIRDDTYTTYAALPAVAGEPIMLYTATTDGQLHAFKVSASVNTDGFTTNTAANNELWSFFPPAVLQHLMPNYNSGGANLLDGAPVIADIPAVTADPPLFERTPSNAPMWRRVLVASGGQAGGFYYALDITDPANPTFLWQLATDDANHPLFGATTPTPSIAIVTLDSHYTGSHHYTDRTQVPVAILPGGTGTQATPCPNGATTYVAPMTNIDPFNPSNPNGTIFPISSFVGPPLRCWTQAADNSQGVLGIGNFNNGSSASGNSITIVRLDTGEVLAHFTGPNYFGAIGNQLTNHPGSGKDIPVPNLSAPVTGIPAIYPPDTGQSAQRMYVGDSDGLLWRIDLSQPDPQNWLTGFSRAWDAYAGTSSATKRQAVELQPVLSRDPLGNIIIIFATGDQAVLTEETSSNAVWSLTETPALLSTSQNWNLHFDPGNFRVTGPMALFNNVLYFAAYTPLASNACSDGYPSLWAVDYRHPSATSNPYLGAPAQPLGGTSLFETGVHGSVIFGVAATQLPSCGGTVNTSDAYFGSHTQVTGGGGEYRIMWQTGANSGINTGGIAGSAARAEGTIAAMQNMTVAPPGQGTRIDSWGAMVE
jgi:type IV pilus assembly protein PilY1